MQKYTASELVQRAKQLADLQNSSFLSYGELFRYVNQAYRKIYQDGITIGDLFYLKEIAIDAGKWELPVDFYQLLSVKRNKVELTRDEDYRIVNNTIEVKEPAVLQYFPTPDTITVKAPRKEIAIPITPVTGFGDLIMSADGRIYDVRNGTFVKSSGTAGSYILGQFSYLSGTDEYDFSENKIASYSHPVLSNGLFREWSEGTIGWGNEDLSAVFTVQNGNLHYNGDLIAEGYTPGLNARVIEWNGQPALVDLKKITYSDGSWETTDNPKAIALLKTDLNTGYGVICKVGSTFWMEGWTPETKIDYPSNTCFDLVAYEMAIQFRIKQNADVGLLSNAYNSLHEVYSASLSQDGGNYPTIKNTRGGWNRWAY